MKPQYTINNVTHNGFCVGYEVHKHEVINDKDFSSRIAFVQTHKQAKSIVELHKEYDEFNERQEDMFDGTT